MQKQTDSGQLVVVAYEQEVGMTQTAANSTIILCCLRRHPVASVLRYW